MDETHRRAPAIDRPVEADQAREATEAQQAKTEGAEGGVMSESRRIACMVQTLGLIAAVFTVTLSVITAPDPPQGEPLRLHWRPATEQEQRAYEVARLHEALSEWQRTQSPPDGGSPGRGVDVTGPGR